MRGTDPESSPNKLAEDTVLEALFKTPIQPPFEQCVLTKMHCSIHTTKASDEAHEEISQRRALEIVVGESNLVPTSGERSTIDGAKVAVGATESGPVDDPVGSGKPNPPTYL
ncbi:hypothetical protein EJD97_015142 [Solanum chilense]|uniref:Uncharacterized protein n=1 Tax=Solanum chilense TaxID=4083 RepID=A0A6N2B9X8_SOLCI|nr:hypothetical protein EJD97_015142 [Solanum chilense]